MLNIYKAVWKQSWSFLPTFSFKSQLPNGGTVPTQTGWRIVQNLLCAMSVFLQISWFKLGIASKGMCRTIQGYTLIVVLIVIYLNILIQLLKWIKIQENFWGMITN